jgi:hypothetical protein
LTEQDVKRALMASLSGVPDADNVATSLLNLAKARVARENDVDYNRKWLTFALTASKSEYNVGSDVLAGSIKVWNMQGMFRTDTSDWPIEVWGLDRFNSHARGRTGTGPPRIATIYGPPGERVIEFYPIPDSAYTVGATFEVQITDFSSIFSRYPDVIYKQALNMLAMAKSPMAAMREAEAAIYDTKKDGVSSWSGTNIPTSRHLTRPG